MEQATDQDSVVWAPVAEHLRDTYGLPPLVTDVFLCFLCRRNHRALDASTGEPIEVRLGMSAGAQVRLQRGALVGAAEWHRLRDLGHELFDVARPPSLRSLQGQDRFAARLGEAGRGRRTVLQALHERVVHLGVEEGDRLRELASANERLKPLGSWSTDSFEILSELLGQWPDDPSDPLRKIVREAESIRDALAELNENARRNLQAALGGEGSEVGGEVRDHLARLEDRLKAAQEELPLTAEWVKEWNRESQELIRRLIVKIPPPPPLPPPPSPSPSPSEETLLNADVDPADDGAIRNLVGEVQRTLEGLLQRSPGPGKVRVTFLRREGGE